MALMASNATCTPVNLGNPDEFTINSFTKFIQDLVQSNVPVTHLPANQDDPQKRKPDISRARALVRSRTTRFFLSRILSLCHFVAFSFLSLIIINYFCFFLPLFSLSLFYSWTGPHASPSRRESRPQSTTSAVRSKALRTSVSSPISVKHTTKPVSPCNKSSARFFCISLSLPIYNTIKPNTPLSCWLMAEATKQP